MTCGDLLTTTERVRRARVALFNGTLLGHVTGVLLDPQRWLVAAFDVRLLSGAPFRTVVPLEAVQDLQSGHLLVSGDSDLVDLRVLPDLALLAARCVRWHHDVLLDEGQQLFGTVEQAAFLWPSGHAVTLTVAPCRGPNERLHVPVRCVRLHERQLIARRVAGEG